MSRNNGTQKHLYSLQYLTKLGYPPQISEIAVRRLGLFYLTFLSCYISILLTKITAAQNEVALSYHRVRGHYILAVAFVGLYLSVDKLCRCCLHTAV